MRFLGQKSLLKQAALCSGALFFFLAAISTTALGQTAPYVLPYTMSTYAGPHVSYTVGQACANGIGIALDGAGDGCLSSSISVGIDPHDLRVDGSGNIFFEDNTSAIGVVHKINPFNTLMTIYAGSLVQTKPCSVGDKYGDGCIANDGAANSSASPLYTPPFKASRGIGVEANGDLFIAGYNSYYTHKIAASTLLQTAVIGTGTSGNFDGSRGVSTENAARGIGADANGNVYIADTGNNVLRVQYNGAGTIPPTYTNGVLTVGAPVAGNTYTVTAPNSAGTKTVVNAVPNITVLLSAPEDVQVDTNGNIYIADAGNSIVRAIYMGSGRLPGVAAPVLYNTYTIAGCTTAIGCTAVGYPKDGTSPTALAATTAISDRKISLDNRNNLYINDASANVVWFVDNATGYIRVLAGSYGVTTGGPAYCFTSGASTSMIGDGCPGPLSYFNSASTNPGFGSSPDNQGNLYLTDPEGASNAANSRIRKVLSGVNFPATTPGVAVTQKVEVHFAAGDTPAAANAFVLTTNGDFTLVGTPACTVETDSTDDCLLTVAFNPTRPGNDTATLTIRSTGAQASAYLLTGTGTAASLAFDPGNVTLLNSTIRTAQGIVLDGAGNAYVADTANNRILFVTAAGVPSTFAGTGTAGYTGDGAAATAATLRAPRAVAIDTSGNLFIADTGNNVIRRVAANGTISTYAGGGTTTCAQTLNTRGDGCPATQATLNAPAGLAADNLGLLYIADTGNNLIRQVNVNGYISTLAGGASTVCATNTDTQGDGCSALSTTFSAPAGLAYDATGQNLFVADTGNNIVRKIYLANTITTSGTTASTVFVNPVTLIAGNGQAGKSIDSGQNATLSQLNGPTGVAVDAAGNTYIADTGNSAVRLVSAKSGVISTIVGILGTNGTSTPPSTAIATQLNAPSALAINGNSALIILDAGNNRVLTDNRSQITYDFGRTNVGQPSPVQNFSEINTGLTSAPLATPVFTASGNVQFSLAPAANSNGSIPACATALTSGSICNIQGSFAPATTGPATATYAENGTGVASGVAPSVTLTGLGAILTKTTSTVAQTIPATGNSQFGGSVTLTGTVTPATCNTSAPSCIPSGTVTFVVDGTANSPVALDTTGKASQAITGLSVGNHTVSCNYSGDAFYAASSCGNVTIAVSQATTTSLLSASNNNSPQFLANNCSVVGTNTTCITTTLTATVMSNTSGTPTGTVTFYANGTAVGTAPLNASTGVANLNLAFTRDQNGNLVSNTSLAPGSYTLTCTYGGASNFAGSSCAAITYVVAAQAVGFTLTTRGCSVNSITVGSNPPGVAVPCMPAAGTSNSLNESLDSSGVPIVAVAQGSTTDATIFITPSNTVSGALTFSCSGLPANSICTFSPTSITLVPSTNLATPIYTDVTLWTDIQPGSITSQVRLGGDGISLAAMLGWPVTLLGLAGIFAFRRKTVARGYSLLAAVFLLAGSSLVLSGCGAGGPGAYKPALTPAGTYPITIMVKGAGVTKTTLVNFKVTAPGITGQE